MVLLDLQKAFDSVWHNALIFKLHALGFRYKLLKLIKSYLSCRSFYVRADGAASSARPVTAGVPQGSILGPVLFNLFINDIPTLITCMLALFADDTALLTTSRRPWVACDRLQRYLNTVLDYFNRWKLAINASKTEAILFTRQQNSQSTHLIVNGHVVQWSKNVTYLGVVLDYRLTDYGLTDRGR